MLVEDIVFSKDLNKRESKWQDIGLPSGWQVAHLADVVDEIDYGLSKAIPKTPPPGGIKIVSTADITRNGDILYQKIRLTEAPERTISRLTLQDGDVLFNWRNSANLIGKTAIFRSQPAPHIFASFILRICCGKQTLSNAYLKLLMRYYRERGIFIKLSRRAVNQANYNKSEISSLNLPVPPFAEQQKIAYVLSVVQRAMEQQERLIQTTTELKKALMQKLFTEGTRGERQKQTEIGPVPQSWDVKRLDEITDNFQYGTSVKCNYETDGPPVLRIPNVVGGHVDTSDIKFGNPKPNELERLPLRFGDLLFVRTNGVKANAGRCSMYRDEFDGDCFYASYLIRVRLDPKKLKPAFLDEYSRTSAGVSFLAGQAIRTADGKFNINSGTLQRMLVAVPEPKEQTEIAKAAAVVDRKKQIHVDKLKVLSDLFKTLLHKLMTAEIRVHDIDLPGFKEYLENVD